MYNWNDVEVEQKIAQERYESIVEGRRVEQARSKETADFPTSSTSRRLLGWIGDLLVSWGCALQKQRDPDFQAAACH